MTDFLFLSGRLSSKWLTVSIQFGFAVWFCSGQKVPARISLFIYLVYFCNETRNKAARCLTLLHFFNLQVAGCSQKWMYSHLWSGLQDFVHLLHQTEQVGWEKPEGWRPILHQPAQAWRQGGVPWRLQPWWMGVLLLVWGAKNLIALKSDLVKYIERMCGLYYIWYVTYYEDFFLFFSSALGAVEEEHVVGVQHVESQQKLLTKPSATHKKSSQSNLVMSSCVLSGKLETGLR